MPLIKLFRFIINIDKLINCSSIRPIQIQLRDVLWAHTIYFVQNSIAYNVLKRMQLPYTSFSESFIMQLQ